MICYLVRHGKDDDSVRGGWSATALSEEGLQQVEALALRFSTAHNISIIYSSDLLRAKQTAAILSDTLSVPVVEKPEFRETNNGVLAGMPNDIASTLYPGLHWSSLDWEQSYPEGESPCQFYHRIANAWQALKTEIRNSDRNGILVTHGGVINVIQCIENGIPYTNKANPFPTGYADVVSIAL